MSKCGTTELTAAVLSGVTDAYKNAPDRVSFAEICELLMGMAIDADQKYSPKSLCDTYVNLMRDNDRNAPYNPMLKSDVAALLEYAVFYLKAAALFSDELQYKRDDIIKTLHFNADNR